LNQATFIIDGYNLMWSILSRRAKRESLERSRALLESRLEEFLRASRGARIFLVYDGARGVFASARREPRFEVHFAMPPRTADDLVIELCRKLEGSPGLHVVTSDFKDIASRVASLRLRHLTAREFGSLIESRTGKVARRGATVADDTKPEGSGPEEVDDWVRKFGFEDSGEGP